VNALESLSTVRAIEASQMNDRVAAFACFAQCIGVADIGNGHRDAMNLRMRLARDAHDQVAARDESLDQVSTYEPRASGDGDSHDDDLSTRNVAGGSCGLQEPGCKKGCKTSAADPDRPKANIDLRHVIRECTLTTARLV
jgi:hypothetical protein